MALFSFISKKTSPEEEMKQAKAAFEKVASLRSNSREAHSMRVRMGMLCRAHLDKTFIAGAEQTALWQEAAALALASGDDAPELPTASRFQKVKSGEAEIFVYLPDEYVNEAFLLGCKYQKTQINAEKAVEGMQALANQISSYDLRLPEPFMALSFLRDELSAESGEAETGADEAPTQEAKD
jgi:hypothetical protein